MKTIKIALSLALGMTAACYVGPGDDLEPDIDDRGQKIRINSQYTTESSSSTMVCNRLDDEEPGRELAARTPTAETPPPPPNAPTNQELIAGCEMLPEIELDCENICDAAGLDFTGEIGIDPGSVTYEVSPPHPSGGLCADGSDEMQTVTTATAVCACCCEAPEPGGSAVPAPSAP